MEDGRRRGWMPGRGLVALLALLTGVPSTAGGQQPPDSTQLPEAMRRLQPLVGEWRADSVAFLEPDGSVRRNSSAESVNRAYLDGLAVHHSGRLEVPEIRTEGWYYWEPTEGRLRMASVSSGGTYDEFVGGWRGDTLVMEAEPRDHYGDRTFRLITWDVTPDGYSERLEVSADGGTTWRVLNRQRFRRIGRGSTRDTITLRPGDPAVDGDRIAPYRVVWLQYFEREGRRTLRRTIVDRVERESAPGIDHLVRTQTFLDPDGSTSSERVSRVERATLAPVRERWRFGERLTQVDYEVGRVSGAMIERGGGGPTVVFDKRLEEPGFDFNVAPLILSATQLETGLALRVPHVRIAPPAFSVPELVWARFRVEGREEVDAGPLGELEAQRVVDPEHDMAFWLIEDPPYVVKVAFPIDDSTHSIMQLGTISPLAGGE